MKLTVLAAAVSIALSTVPSQAEELQIGHLETADDSGSDGSQVANWLFLHCDHQKSKLYCDAFQTLIYHEISQAAREAEIAKMSQGDVVGDIKDTFKGGCGPLDQALAAAAKGKTVDGRQLHQEGAQDTINSIRIMATACHNPSPANINAITAMLVDHEIKTCKVHQAHSQMEFTWDQTQTAWLLQQGPEAQCRTVTTGVLKKDPVSGFWDYTETQTHDDVMILGKNVSCKKFDRTFSILGEPHLRR
jgi:hypothetical protein